MVYRKYVTSYHWRFCAGHNIDVALMFVLKLCWAMLKIVLTDLSIGYTDMRVDVDRHMKQQ